MRIKTPAGLSDALLRVEPAALLFAHRANEYRAGYFLGFADVCVYGPRVGYRGALQGFTVCIPGVGASVWDIGYRDGWLDGWAAWNCRN
jgi:hypothetical protein